MPNNFVARFAKIHEDARLPEIATQGSVGYDIFALEEVEIYPGQVKLIKTGIVAVPPEGTHFELFLRSSTPKKNPGLVLANSTGIIDSDYVGPEDEIKIMLLNTNERYRISLSPSAYTIPIAISKGQKIAQLLLRENIVAPIKEISSSDLKKKSRGGFGHSGE